MEKISIKEILRLVRPLFLLDSALMYTLGVGIARYLGHIIDIQIFILGLAWTLALQLSAHFLGGYFSQPKTQARRTENESDTEQRLVREVPLWIGITALTVTTSFALILMRSGVVDGAVYLVMGFLLLGAFVSVMPPFRLVDTPYRDLVLSVLLANIVPALAFILQGEGVHRLVSMTTFPLTLLHFSMLMIFEFRPFANDLKFDRATLLVRLGWQGGMRLTNVLILAAFLLLGVAMLIGLPMSLALPAFLVLPLALFLIWYLTRIEQGAKPHWNALHIMAVLVFGLTAYLLAFSFWTN